MDPVAQQARTVRRIAVRSARFCASNQQQRSAPWASETCKRVHPRSKPEPVGGSSVSVWLREQRAWSGLGTRRTLWRREIVVQFVRFGAYNHQPRSEPWAAFSRRVHPGRRAIAIQSACFGTHNHQPRRASWAAAESVRPRLKPAPVDGSSVSVWQRELRARSGPADQIGRRAFRTVR